VKYICLLIIPLLLSADANAFDGPSQQQLAEWLKRFPKADTNGDGKLSVKEATAYQQKRRKSAGRQNGAPSTFEVDPGWKSDSFPDHAVCYRTPKEIQELYTKTPDGQKNSITSYPKPADGALRIVGTGHSFMAPGYTTLPAITRAAGLNQPPLVTHTGGGMTGSTRYKWEQENGIFQFDRQPTPKLLASISNAEWDAMMWGPYFQDQPEYYLCWMDFSLKYNPQMKFYLSDAWPQLGQLQQQPKSEDELTPEVFAQMGAEKNVATTKLVGTLNAKHPQKVFVMPTNDAMVLAADYYSRGELPGVEGIHRLIGKKERSLWHDHLGHLGPGLGDLEGYVFYATLYGRSPELIEDDVNFRRDSNYPSRELDRMFRRIAWQAVTNHPLSGVVDADKDGINDLESVAR
jgi:hypothetical protein